MGKLRVPPVQTASRAPSAGILILAVSAEKARADARQEIKMQQGRPGIGDGQSCSQAFLEAGVWLWDPASSAVAGGRDRKGCQAGRLYSI